MPKKPMKKPLPKSTPPAAVLQSERVMLALTPEELKRLETYANDMSNSIGARVGVATAARSLLLRELRRVEEVLS